MNRNSLAHLSRRVRTLSPEKRAQGESSGALSREGAAPRSRLPEPPLPFPSDPPDATTRLLPTTGTWRKKTCCSLYNRFSLYSEARAVRPGSVGAAGPGQPCAMCGVARSTPPLPRHLRCRGASHRHQGWACRNERPSTGEAEGKSDARASFGSSSYA